MKINIITSFFENTGYAIHGKSLANALNDAGCDVRIECSKPPQWERLVNDFELNAMTKDYDPDSTTIMISQPQAWPIGLAQKPKHFIGFLVWEGDCIPEDWLRYLIDKRVDKIFVPSIHTKNSISNLLNKSCNNNNINKFKYFYDKIEIVPHGYSPSKIYFTQKKYDKPFTFIANKGWSRGINDRGGIQWLIKAFFEEFTIDDNVQLILKINPIYNNPQWNFDNEMQKLKIKKTDNRPRIGVINDFIDENQLRNFYNEGDVFVSTSMAEGFNLPCIEAMACGLPVITTFFGGQIDFVNDTNGWLINQGEFGYFSNEISYEETKWFKPQIQSIRNILRHCYNNPDKVNLKSKCATETSKGYTWLNTAKIVKEIIKKM